MCPVRHVIANGLINYASCFYSCWICGYAATKMMLASHTAKKISCASQVIVVHLCAPITSWYTFKNKVMGDFSSYIICLVCRHKIEYYPILCLHRHKLNAILLISWMQAMSRINDRAYFFFNKCNFNRYTEYSKCPVAYTLCTVKQLLWNWEDC